MATKYYLSTTGTVSQVNLKDLGLIFNHPIINSNLLDRVNLEMVLNSKSLYDSLINNEIILRDENANLIDPKNYYKRESIALTLENKVKTSNLDLLPDFLGNKLSEGTNIVLSEEILLGQRRIKISNPTGFDKNNVWNQTTPTTSVSINHNLHKYCSVNITDENFKKIEVYWEYIDLDNVLVAPDIPTTFKATFN
jgi:hypothetical protein